MDDFKKMMQKRTLSLAHLTICYCNEMPKTQDLLVIKKQLVRSITSVGANYHASCRAKSTPDFINKLHIVEEECDESIYWIKLLALLGQDKNEKFDRLSSELEEIIAITVASIKTLKGKMS